MDPQTTITLSAGSVEYSLDEAAVPIEELIALLEEAKEDGATHVVGTSGNYRGAQWVRLGGHFGYGWADE
jgi:pyruvate-formate lyase-activating enzyme